MTETVQVKATSQEQIDSMMPALHKLLPQIIEIAKLYHHNYPAETTSDDVINAITVAVPLRHFMISAAILTHLAMIDRAKAPKQVPMNDPEVAG